MLDEVKWLEGMARTQLALLKQERAAAAVRRLDEEARSLLQEMVQAKEPAAFAFEDSDGANGWGAAEEEEDEELGEGAQHPAAAALPALMAAELRAEEEAEDDDAAACSDDDAAAEAAGAGDAGGVAGADPAPLL